MNGWLGVILVEVADDLILRTNLAVLRDNCVITNLLSAMLRSLTAVQG